MSANMHTIGIRHEDKYAPERRTPLVPDDIRQLVNRHGISVCVESSPKRVFTNDEFEAAGARVEDDVSSCDIIFGVKEMPVGYFRKGGVYIYFSHVIKGQSQNMPMLRDLMDAGATLIDYERIVDYAGQRLIFFGRHAGLAGMINTIWTLGRRLKALGRQTPFLKVNQAASYNSLADVRADIRAAGELIASDGLPAGAGPVVFGVTGDGNVARGSLEILDLLPVEEISPSKLRAVKQSRSSDPNPGRDSEMDLNANLYLESGKLYKINLTPADYMVHRKGETFDFHHYIAHPEEYESRFEDFLPHINVLVNGIYWDERYPRLVTKSYLQKIFSPESPHLWVIGDITCDPDGSIECTVKATGIEDPVFVYDPSTGSHKMGFEGNGVAVMAVDILPSELPRESSEHFSRSLEPWIPKLAIADYKEDFESLDLPDELKRAVIVYNGQLTPDYMYLQKQVK